MPAVKALNIIALSLSFLLLALYAAPARDRNDVAALNQQIKQLYTEGRYSEAIPLARRVVAIQQKALGPNHLDVATALFKLAWLFERQGHYTDAEPVYKRSLVIRETTLGPDQSRSWRGAG